MASLCKTQVASSCLSGTGCNSCVCYADSLTWQYAFGSCHSGSGPPYSCDSCPGSQITFVTECNDFCTQLSRWYQASLAFLVISNFGLLIFASYVASHNGEFNRLLHMAKDVGFVFVFISVGTNPQRLLRLKLQPEIPLRQHLNLALSIFYFVFATVPQLAVQLVYLQKFGASSLAIVSMFFTLYSVISNLGYRFFLFYTTGPHPSLSVVQPFEGQPVAPSVPQQEKPTEPQQQQTNGA